MDYPHVRSSTVCPLCQERKEVGLVVCWPCYRAWGLRDGNAGAESIIERAEADFREAWPPPPPPVPPFGGVPPRQGFFFFLREKKTLSGLSRHRVCGSK